MVYIGSIINKCFHYCECCGHDNISSTVLEIIAMEVSPCLTLIINQVLSTGQFPKNLKTAKVIPIHKTGDKSVMKNYRPISIYNHNNNIRRGQERLNMVGMIMFSY